MFISTSIDCQAVGSRFSNHYTDRGLELSSKHQYSADPQPATHDTTRMACIEDIYEQLTDHVKLCFHMLLRGAELAVSEN
jgi:hypothetical protein